MLDDALHGLDPEQRLVAEAVTGPVVVHAGAGTGKTRAITHRIAHAVHTGTHVAQNGLAVTFTNRAAGEMRQRLAELGVVAVGVRTFHAAALSQLRYFWPAAVGGPFPSLVSAKGALVTQACRELGLPSGRLLVRDLAAEIEWAGSSMLSAGGYAEAAAAAGRTPVGSGADLIDLPGIARVMTGYQDAKSAANAIDFEDVLLSLIALIGDRPDIADEIHRHYRWFTVDEYQDITPAQDRLLSSWLGEGDDVCVVGDASQTIYSFAGASAHALADFARRWPNATEVRLDRCYRCTPQIVAAANSVLRTAVPEDGGARDAVVLRSQRQPGPAPEIVACADEAEEAQAVVARIAKALNNGLRPRDIAVLMRTNAASEPLEVALAEAGIGYTMRGAERFFARPEVREAIVRLRGQAVAAAQGPAQDLAGQVEAVLAGMGWLASGPASAGATRERWESLAAVLALAHEVAASGRGNMLELVAEFERRAQLSHAPSADAVTIATLHSAKGLEWPLVFILGAVEGGLPITYADTPARIEEERRLFYVGLTRARDQLVITWAMTRAGSARHRQASRFLAALRSPEPATGGSIMDRAVSGLVRRGGSQAPRVARVRPAARCRTCQARLIRAEELTLGRCLRCPSDADPQLGDRLQRWRAAEAGHQGIGEGAVLRDLTLQAIAERRPTSGDDLAEIPEFRPDKLARYGPQILALVAAGSSAG